MKIIYFFVLFISLFTNAQTASFPQQYIGTWKGTLEIYNPEGTVVNSVPMELEIKATGAGDRYIWKTVYNNSDVRDYELVAVDRAKGKYRVDEKNGIVLDLRLFGAKAFTCFEVDGYLIYDFYTFNGNEIVFELTSSAPQAITKSGNGTTESPAVTSYAQVAYQKAVLKRIK